MLTGNRSRDKIGVAEFRLDLCDLQAHPLDFSVETGLLRREIDEAGERQRNDLATYEELKRAGRRGSTGTAGFRAAMGA